MALDTNLQDFATRTATEVKALRTLLNGNVADLSALTTADKASLVAALNWLHAELSNVAGGAAGINDEATGTTTTWSSDKISTQISAAVSDLVDGAPTALDTLQELAAAIQDNESGIGAITTALDNRVRFDAVQSLTEPQKVQARANIGAGTSDLTLGTTASTAKAGNYQPTWEQVTGKPTTFQPISHQHLVADLSDSTAVGRSVVTAVDAAAARSAIGAASAADVGNTDVDLVAVFEAGLV